MNYCLLRLVLKLTNIFEKGELRMKGSRRIFNSSLLFMIIIFLGSPIIFSSPSVNIHPSLGEPFYVREAGD
jgi:hypothetical protein